MSVRNDLFRDETIYVETLLAGQGIRPGESFIAEYRRDGTWLPRVISNDRLPRDERQRKAALTNGARWLGTYLINSMDNIRNENGLIRHQVVQNPGKMSVNLATWVKRLEAEGVNERGLLSEFSAEMARLPKRAPFTQEDVKLLSDLSTPGYGQKREIFGKHTENGIVSFRAGNFDYAVASLTNGRDAQRSLGIRHLASKVEHLREHMHDLDGLRYQGVTLNREEIRKNLALFGAEMHAKAADPVVKNSIRNAVDRATAATYWAPPVVPAPLEEPKPMGYIDSIKLLWSYLTR